jgi:hypothetical protein
MRLIEREKTNLRGVDDLTKRVNVPPERLLDLLAGQQARADLSSSV